MSFRKALLRAQIAVLAVLPFAGCVMDGSTPAPVAAPNAAVTDVQNAFERTKTESAPLLQSLSSHPGNYYFQLRVRSAATPADPNTCLGKSLEEWARQLFFKNGISGMVYVDVGLSDPNAPVTNQSPVVVLSEDENAQPPNDPCFTSAFTGYISPLIRADATTTITITPKRKYSSTADVAAATRILQLASVASSAFGGAGLALGTFNATDLQGKASAVDTEISSAFTGSVTDVRPQTFPFGDGKNAVVVRLLNIQHDDLKGVSLSDQTGALAVIDLVPVKSVFAKRPSDSDAPDTYKPAYNLDPNQILQYQVNSGGKQILDLINTTGGFKDSYSKIDLKSDSAADQLGQACNALNGILSGQLRLSTDDVRIARWAALKVVATAYDTNFNIRSDFCWSADDKTALAGEPGYAINDARPDDSPTLAALDQPLVLALLSMKPGSYSQIQNLVDVSSFQIASWGSQLAPLNGVQWNTLTGTSALDAFSRLGTFSAGCFQVAKSDPTQPRTSLAKTAIVIVQVGDKGQNNTGLPAAIIRGTDSKITRLIFGDVNSIGAYVGTPDGWADKCIK